MGTVILGLPSQGSAQPKAEPRERDAAKISLSDEAELARVISLYEAGKYSTCSDELAQLLDGRSARPLKNPEVVERARLYHAACLIGRGSPGLADEPLRAAIRHNPQMKPPDSLDFPPPVVERFLRVREGLLEEIRAREQERVRVAKEQALAEERKVLSERARLRELERISQQETVILKNRRWIALVPFGVGQFQNGNAALGWTFLVSEALLAGTALTALAVQSRINAEAVQALQGGSELELSVNDRLRDWQSVLVASSYGLGALMAIGIAESQLSFVPELREVRPRALPPKRPTLDALGHSWQIAPAFTTKEFALTLRTHF